MRTYCETLSQLIDESNRLYPFDWEGDPDQVREDYVIERSPEGYTRHITRDTGKVTIYDSYHAFLWSDTVCNFRAEMQCVDLEADIPTADGSTRHYEKSITIGGSGGKLCDVIEFEAILKKIVRALKKGGSGSLDICYATYAHQDGRLVQMSFDEWKTDDSCGDICDEGVYLRPVTRYTDPVKDRFLVTGTFEELNL